MFGRKQQMQVVSLDDLTNLIRQVTAASQASQTTITINVYGGLHVHQAGSGYQQLPAGLDRLALPAAGSIAWPDPREAGGAKSLDYLDRALGALIERH